MTQSAAAARLVLAGALTIGTADTVHATLRAAIEPTSGVGPTDISIDCSEAGEIDLSFIQLLIAARISAQLLGRAVSLATCPDGALLDTLTRGGFQVVCEGGPKDTAAFWFAGEGG